MIHETRQRTYRVRTTAKAKEEELVAVDVVVGNRAVKIADVALDPFSGRAADQVIHPFLRADPVVVDHALMSLVTRARENGSGDFRHVGDMPALGFVVDLVAEVPGAVGTNDQPLHDGSPMFSCSRLYLSVVNWDLIPTTRNVRCSMAAGPGAAAEGQSETQFARDSTPSMPKRCAGSSFEALEPETPPSAGRRFCAKRRDSRMVLEPVLVTQSPNAAERPIVPVRRRTCVRAMPGAAAGELPEAEPKAVPRKPLDLLPKGTPLLDLVSYPRPGPGRRDRLWAAEVEQTVRPLVQVIF